MTDDRRPPSKSALPETARSGQHRLHLSTSVMESPKDVEKGKQEVERVRTPVPPKDAAPRPSVGEAKEAAKNLVQAVEELVAPMFLILGRLNSVVRYTKIGIAIASILVLVLIYLVWKVSKVANSLDASRQQQAEMVQKLSGVVGELQSLAKSNEAVKKDIKQVREDSEDKTKVEIVPETDPAKAVHAPLKVRVIPAPVHSARAAAPPLAATKPAEPQKAAIEFPINPRQLKVESLEQPTKPPVP